MNELLMALLGMGGGGGGGNYNNFGAPSGQVGGPLFGAPQQGGNQWFGGGPLQGGGPQQMPPGQSYDPFQGMFSQPGRGDLLGRPGNETHPYGYGPEPMRQPGRLADAGGNKGGGYGGPQPGGGPTYGGRPMPMPRERPYQPMPRPGMGIEPYGGPQFGGGPVSVGGMVNPGDPADYRPGGIYSPEGQRRINAASRARYGSGPFTAL